jgi:methyl acetate hydrolase
MSTSPSVTEQIDEVLAAAVEDGAVPGVAALVGDRDGIVYSGASGSRGDDALFTPDTVGWLASTTKALVAVGALQLVERGVVDLDAPIGPLLPQLADLGVLEGFADDGTPRIRPARSAVTLRNLLSHTAGNVYHFWNANALRYQRDLGLPSIDACRNATLTTPLMFDPGTAWEYGMNIDWVGKAVEAASGLSLGDYLRANVLDPLGMADTTFRLSAEHRSRLATMHVRTPDGPVPMRFEVPQDPEFQMGGGGMYGSPADYLRFLRMLLREGELDGARILAPETVAQARRNQIGDLTVRRLETALPSGSHDVDFLPGTTKKWSLLGMLNVEATPGGRSPGSLFWAGLCNSYYWVDWHRGDAGLLVTQILPFADPAVLDLFDRFEETSRRL